MLENGETADYKMYLRMSTNDFTACEQVISNAAHWLFDSNAFLHEPTYI